MTLVCGYEISVAAGGSAHGTMEHRQYRLVQPAGNLCFNRHTIASLSVPCSANRSSSRETVTNHGQPRCKSRPEFCNSKPQSRQYQAGRYTGWRNSEHHRYGNRWYHANDLARTNGDPDCFCCTAPAGRWSWANNRRRSKRCSSSWLPIIISDNPKSPCRIDRSG